jgi:hypothetical protein
MICSRCNRVLKTESSQKAGMGPVCLRKTQEAEKAMTEKKEK